MTNPSSPIYDASKVTVAAAALYIAPAYTPQAPDSSILWDPTNWTGKTLTLNSATALTMSVTNMFGTQTTASVATPTGANIQTALAGLSNVGVGNVAVTPTGAGGPFKVVFANGLGACTLAVTASTGGVPAVTDGLWIPAGASEAGWTYQASRQTQDITIEEQSTPVNRFITSTTAQITGNASEDGITQVQWSMNALKSLVAQASGQPAVTVLTMSDDLVHYAAVLETRNHQGLPRRYGIPDVVAGDGLTQAFRRVAQQHLVPLSFVAVCPPSAITIRNITAPALP